jgi:hypothetical protein
MVVNVKGCTVTVENSVDRVMPAMVSVMVVDTSATSLTVEVTTAQSEQVEGQTPSCEVGVSLAVIAALAVTIALLEPDALVAALEALPAELESDVDELGEAAAAAADIELGVAVETVSLCTAPSVCTAVDVEVEVMVT